MTYQAELLPTKMPDATDACRGWLEYYLGGHPGWHTAAEILRAGCREVTEDNKRWVRRLANGCAAVMSGQRGYCHLRHANPDEISHAAAWLEHQAKEMAERAARLRRAGHRLLAT